MKEKKNYILKNEKNENIIMPPKTPMKRQSYKNVHIETTPFNINKLEFARNTHIRKYTSKNCFLDAPYHANKCDMRADTFFSSEIFSEGDMDSNNLFMESNLITYEDKVGLVFTRIDSMYFERNYVVVDKVGQGDFCEVYLAKRRMEVVGDDGVDRIDHLSTENDFGVSDKLSFIDNKSEFIKNNVNEGSKFKSVEQYKYFNSNKANDKYIDNKKGQRYKCLNTDETNGKYIDNNKGVQYKFSNNNETSDKYIDNNKGQRYKCSNNNETNGKYIDSKGQRYQCFNNNETSQIFMGDKENVLYKGTNNNETNGKYIDSKGQRYKCSPNNETSQIFMEDKENVQYKGTNNNNDNDKVNEHFIDNKSAQYKGTNNEIFMDDKEKVICKGTNNNQTINNTTTNYFERHSSNCNSINENITSTPNPRIDPNKHNIPSSILEPQTCIKISNRPFLGPKDRLNKLKEVEILYRLKGHSNVLQIKTAWEENGILYIESEYCAYGTLKSLIHHVYYERSGNFDDDLIFKFMYEMGRGLKNIHDMKIIHSDLKPDNIYIAIKQKDGEARNMGCTLDENTMKKSVIEEDTIEREDDSMHRNHYDKSIIQEEITSAKNNLNLGNNINKTYIQEEITRSKNNSNLGNNINKTYIQEEIAKSKNNSNLGNNINKTYIQEETVVNKDNDESLYKYHINKNRINEETAVNKDNDESLYKYHENKNRINEDNIIDEIKSNKTSTINFISIDEESKEKETKINKYAFLNDIDSFEFKIGDFNISRYQNDEFEEDGDKKYMPPENLLSQGVPQSDIYSLGLIYLELITRICLPTTGEKWLKLRRNNFRGLNLNKNVQNKSMKSILLKMIDKDWEKRICAYEIVRAFENMKRKG